MSNRRIALALLPLLAMPGVLASMAHYHSVPVEHDDLGRSDEPDFGATAVLGSALSNCVVAFDALRTPGLGRACVPDESLGAAGPLAPGCTDDAGRRPSGLCGLHTLGLGPVPPGTLGVPGMGGAAAPGLTRTKAATVRFLDAQLAALLPTSAHVEANRKLADLGARGVLGAVDPGAGGALAPPAASLWAWYGVWRDANGNGVIDHLSDAAGHARADNEFRWVGGCGELGGDLCIAEPGLRFPAWIWPGDHHQGCGFLIGCYAPADFPGREVVCLAVSGDGELRNLLWCPPERPGVADPVLGGPQLGIAADGAFVDHTGRLEPEQRLWRYGVPPMYFYDQSLLVSAVTVAGPTAAPPDARRAQGWALEALQFVDVDRYPAWTPLLGELLQAAVKPAVHGPWVTARDAVPPLQAWLDGAAHARAVDAPAQGAQPLDDQLRDPGWSREPNHALDRFPAARFTVHAPGGDLPAEEQAHRGWLNDYAGHLGTWRAWADLHARRVDAVYGMWCVQPCSPGGGFGYRDSFSALPAQGRPLRGAGEHDRTLDPGLYMFDGVVGAWRDLPHAMREAVLDLLASAAARAPAVREERYLLDADGWVGNLVNTTGAWRYRGYDDEACTIAGRTASHPWAWCHPYLDADTASAAAASADGLDQSFGLDLSDPQDYRETTEFEPLPPAAPLPALRLRPTGAAWDYPIFVWRDFYAWQVGDTAAIEDWTGRSGALELRTARMHHRTIAADVLVLPVGAPSGLTSELAARVVFDLPGRGLVLDEAVTDVDAYRGWGA